MNAERLERLRADARARGNKIMDRAKDENRNLTSAESADVDAILSEIKAIDKRIVEARADDELRAQIAQLTPGGGRTTARLPGGGVVDSLAGGRSFGAQFLRSEAGRWLLENRGRLPERFTGPVSELAGPELQATTITETAGSGIDLLVPHYLPGITPSPTRPLRVAELLAQGNTDAASVISMREASYTNAAAAVGEGALKPESELVFTAVTDALRKIAHWIPISDEMMNDVPALQSYLDVRLGLGVQIELDDQLVNGNPAAVPPEVSGFLLRPGLAAAVPKGAMSNVDAIATQIAAIETAMGTRPDGIVMHPTNWLRIILSKNGEGLYYGGGPFAQPGAPMLWGLPVAVTSAIAAGTALVGCFRTFAQLFRKGGVRVEASNAHSDYFVRNLIAIRAEIRAALVVYNEAAFGTVTGLDA